MLIRRISSGYELPEMSFECEINLEIRKEWVSYITEWNLNS